MVERWVSSCARLTVSLLLHNFESANDIPGEPISTYQLSLVQGVQKVCSVCRARS